MAGAPLGTASNARQTSRERASLLGALAAGRGWGLVVCVVVGLSIWRAAFVVAGVDPDSDAYGHHTIARQILVDPRDLTVHWVWLPFFHYAQAAAIALGGTLQSVRLFNVVLAAATPLLLYALMRRHRTTDPAQGLDGAPTIAAALAAVSPIAMQMGTTGQTEPLFAALVASTLALLSWARHGLAALALTVAVLLRYEAWAVPPAIAAFLLLARVPWVRARLSPTERASLEGAGARAWLPVVAPLVAIFVWAAIRRGVDGGWFRFLHQTREFATGALGAKSSFALGPAQVLEDLGKYAIKVPWRVVGYPILLVPFGVWRTLRREGLRFFVVFGALLAFVTLTWMLRSSLGLDRHFVVIVPFYAAMIANGIVAVAEGIDHGFRKPTGASVHAFAASGAARAAVIFGLAVAVLGDGWSILRVWMRDWENASLGAWPDRREIAARVRDVDGIVFCDEPTVEILSGLDRHRFDRRQLTHKNAPGWVHDALATGKPVFVATWAVHLKKLGVSGPILARSPGSSGDSGFVLMRVDATR
ncbi:MAG: glycosyltransferase family 39 protein [Deltaproteobacteria bacterium]|nr:glycosyltransferase family 39 protein [Deltaproteobacteria bacterium]